MTEILEGLKEKARDRGLWNFWLNDSELGHGLSTVEYAYLAQEMRSPFQAEVFNCSAPDTGNMEVLLKYGSDDHKKLAQTIAKRRNSFSIFDDRA